MQKHIPRIVCSKQSGANYVIIYNTSPQAFSKSTVSTLRNELLFMKKLSKGTACWDSLTVISNTPYLLRIKAIVSGALLFFSRCDINKTR